MSIEMANTIFEFCNSVQTLLEDGSYTYCALKTDREKLDRADRAAWRDGQCIVCRAYAKDGKGHKPDCIIVETSMKLRKTIDEMRLWA